MEKSALEKEREMIRELHQRQQDSLKCLHALESKLSKVSLDDEETLRGSNPPSRVPTMELMTGPTLEGIPEKEGKFSQASFATTEAESPLTDDSETSDSDGTVTDEDAERLTAEDLAKCAKHVQKLLKRISALQQTFEATKPKPHQRKSRVHKIYRRFCRKFETDVLSQTSTDIRPSLPLPAFEPPSKTSARIKEASYKDDSLSVQGPAVVEGAQTDAAWCDPFSQQSFTSLVSGSGPPFFVTGHHPGFFANPPEYTHQKRPPNMVGQEGMPSPAIRPRGPHMKFTREDDQLIIDLKEKYSLTWIQIADFFPGRSSGTLQVRYNSKLKNSKRPLTGEDLANDANDALERNFNETKAQPEPLDPPPSVRSGLSGPRQLEFAGSLGFHHTPQSNSPASVLSPQCDVYGRPIYRQDVLLPDKGPIYELPHVPAPPISASTTKGNSHTDDNIRQPASQPSMSPTPKTPTTPNPPVKPRHHHHRLPGPQPTQEKQIRDKSTLPLMNVGPPVMFGPPAVFGQEVMPTPKSRHLKPKIKFTHEDDELIIKLREERNLTWIQIADFFPGRSSGTLQVRYTSKLKKSTRPLTRKGDENVALKRNLKEPEAQPELLDSTTSALPGPSETGQLEIEEKIKDYDENASEDLSKESMIEGTFAATTSNPKRLKLSPIADHPQLMAPATTNKVGSSPISNQSPQSNRAASVETLQNPPLQRNPYNNTSFYYSTSSQEPEYQTQYHQLQHSFQPNSHHTYTESPHDSSQGFPAINYRPPIAPAFTAEMSSRKRSRSTSRSHVRSENHSTVQPSNTMLREELHTTSSQHSQLAAYPSQDASQDEISPTVAPKDMGHEEQSLGLRYNASIDSNQDFDSMTEKELEDILSKSSRVSPNWKRVDEALRKKRVPLQSEEQESRPEPVLVRATALPTSPSNIDTLSGQACDRCKVRKIRCDGQPEGCTACVQNGTQCQTTTRIAKRTLTMPATPGGLMRLPEKRGPNRTWACDISDCTSVAVFTRLADLQRHKATCHNSDPPEFLCTVEDCTVQFNRRDHLITHLRTHHNIDTPKRKPGERSANPLERPMNQPDTELNQDRELAAAATASRENINGQSSAGSAGGSCIYPVPPISPLAYRDIDAVDTLPHVHHHHNLRSGMDNNDRRSRPIAESSAFTKPMRTLKLECVAPISTDEEKKRKSGGVSRARDMFSNASTSSAEHQNRSGFASRHHSPDEDESESAKNALDTRPGGTRGVSQERDASPQELPRKRPRLSPDSQSFPSGLR
jgi:hypothetical protein